jgi:hypothetical protein
MFYIKGFPLQIQDKTWTNGYSLWCEEAKKANLIGRSVGCPAGRAATDSSTGVKTNPIPYFP